MGEERIRPTRSGLFMIELLIAVGVFTLCAAICVGLFVRSEVMSRESADLTRMTTEARNIAECWKAAGGDLEKTNRLCGGVCIPEKQLFISYDRDWNPAVASYLDHAETGFTIDLRPKPQDSYTCATLTAYDGDAELFSWELAALEAAS